MERLNLAALNFQRVESREMGRPSYDPRDLLKVLIYGYFYGARSSRRMERECKVNVEVMWLTGKLTPDHNTLSEFRKKNIKCMKPMFREFNKFCLDLNMFSLDYVSIDGSKFRAVNSKDRNFTLSKLDDRLKRLDTHIDEYLAALEESDGEEDGRKLSREELEEKLAKLQERKARYEGYLKELEETGAGQLSLTDPDAKLMKENNGFGVGYNAQTAVDAESHLIAGFEMTNHPTDHGLLTGVAQEVKEDLNVDILEATADKGYHDPQDMAKALENGIIPNVIQNDGSSVVDITYDYEEAEITEEQRVSTAPEDIKTCLHAGIVPKCMENILSEARIEEVMTYHRETTDSDIAKMTLEEMIAKAHEGYFVRDAERNMVICPQGEILRPKSVKKNGNIRYCNKLACKRCKAKCTTAKFKEADFSKDCLLKKVGGWKKDDKNDDGTPRSKVTRQEKKVVRFKLQMDEKKMDNRKCLSEHPFGTIKRTVGESFFLLRRMFKTEGEMALYCLSYNLRRVMNLRTMDELMAGMAK
ncbi:MAG: transposase [Bacteroidales bacterium]|nr:transposase [Bacteroidales bacterium]